MSPRPIFLKQPLHVRLLRWNRLRKAQSMAQPNRRQQPLDRPLNVHRIYLVVIVCTAALFLWIGEGVEKRRQESAQGLYRQSQPIPRTTIDCSREGREICKVRERMSKVRKEA